MASYTKNEMIKAIELSLATELTIVQAINKIKSDNPNPTGSNAIKDEDVEDISPAQIDMMLSSKSLIERIEKKATSENNSDSATTLKEVKKTVRKMNTKKNSFTKLEDNVNTLRKHLGLDKDKIEEEEGAEEEADE